jgi:hypothetical protein
MANEIRFLGRQFTLREALLLGFCATFIVLTRAALRLHFSLPGHSMFFLVFFLLMARGCVPKIGAATLVGVVAGLVCMLLGMAKLGPFILVNFALPAVVVDVACAVRPSLVSSYVGCVLTGVIAAAGKGVTSAVMDHLLGMERDLIVQHVLIATASGIAFGAAGAALVPPVIRRLQANRLFPAS